MADAYQKELYTDWSPYYDQELSNGTPMLVFVGEFDMRLGPTNHDWIKNLIRLKTPENSFFSQSRKIYYVPDGSGNYSVGGYYRYDPVTRFTFMAIPKSGHFVPTT